MITKLKTRLYNLPSRIDTLKVCISEALDTSYNNYLNNLEKNYKYLLYRDNLKVMKTLNREQKKAEQEAEEEEDDLDE